MRHDEKTVEVVTKAIHKKANFADLPWKFEWSGYKDNCRAMARAAISAITNADHEQAIEAAVKAERERCARIADAEENVFASAYLRDPTTSYPNKCHLKGREVEARHIANAIRKGETPDA